MNAHPRKITPHWGEPADPLAAAHFAKVRLPLLEAETLPPWTYSSPGFYNREVEAIFGKVWNFQVAPPLVVAMMSNLVGSAGTVAAIVAPGCWPVRARPAPSSALITAGITACRANCGSRPKWIRPPASTPPISG